MKPIVIALALAATSAPALAVEAGMQLTLPGDVQQITSRYTCGEETEPRVVRYINADPNFLAIVPVDGEDMIFVATLSASGVRYASGPYVWWSTGAEASFSNEMQPDAEPLTCIEFNDIP